MTNVDRIVIELALEVLEDVVHRVSKWDQVRDKDDKPMPPHNQNPEIRQAFEAISLIKKVLAQPKEPEPVAWMHVQGGYEEPSFRQLADDEVERGWQQYPLYTTPPQRTWVSLTDEQMQFLATAIGQAKQIIDTYNTEFVTARDDLRRCSELLAAHNIKE